MRSPPRAVAALLAAALAGAGCGSESPSGGAALPRDFVGIVSEDGFAAQGAARARVLARQARAGVRLLRQTFAWAQIEREPGRYDLSYHDDYVAAAARAGMDVLPILFDPPAFHAGARARPPGAATPPPSDLGAMERFARALVRRYGPDGSLWRERTGVPRRPIRSWQVWNEPNLPAYWGGTPSAAQYARMLRAVGGAIEREDPAAEIVTGGIPNSRLGIGFEPYVRALAAAGARDAFDVLAVHPYARTPDGVLMAMTAARRLLTELGRADAKLWVTELGWASDGPPSPFTVGPAAQAADLRAAIGDLGRHAGELRARGVVYYGWRDADPYPGGKDFWGLHTGLLRRDGTAKPALDAFTEAVGDLPGARP